MSAFGVIADIHKQTTLALLQIDWLVAPVGIKLCTPHSVHALVLRWTECHGRAETNVEVTEIFKCCYKSFRVEFGPIPLQGCNQYVGCNITFKRHVVRSLSREVFGERRFVFESQ